MPTQPMRVLFRWSMAHAEPQAMFSHSSGHLKWLSAGFSQDAMLTGQQPSDEAGPLTLQ